MSVSVLSAAKFSCETSNWSMPHLRLQKLLYISHMLHLGGGKGSLIDGSFEAWDYGPVHPTLYHKAKIFGAAEVKNIFRSYPEIQDGPEKETLEATLDALQGISGAQMVALTHREKGAWAKNYYPGARGNIISDEDIISEYKALIEDSILTVAA